MVYDLYPAVDENYNFPPEVRQALAASTELRNTVVPMSEVERNNLLGDQLWNGRLIFNTTTGTLDQYDASSAEWVSSIITDHGLLDGLGDDDHPQYALRSGIYGYREKIIVPAATSGNIQLDLAQGNDFDITPTGNMTFVLVNASAASRYTPIVIRIGNSTYAITWPAGTKFPLGRAPALNGVTWLGGVVLANGTLVIGASWSGVA